MMMMLMAMSWTLPAPWSRRHQRPGGRPWRLLSDTDRHRTTGRRATPPGTGGPRPSTAMPGRGALGGSSRRGLRWQCRNGLEVVGPRPSPSSWPLVELRPAMHVLWNCGICWNALVLAPRAKFKKLESGGRAKFKLLQPASLPCQPSPQFVFFSPPRNIGGKNGKSKISSEFRDFRRKSPIVFGSSFTDTFGIPLFLVASSHRAFPPFSEQEFRRHFHFRAGAAESRRQEQSATRALPPRWTPARPRRRRRISALLPAAALATAAATAAQ